MKTEEIEVKTIKIASDRLKVDEKVVKQLMDSIPKVGLLHPIIVCRPANQMGVHLVVGRGRLEAHKRLKLKTILARVEHGDTEAVRRWRELAEIDENLIRRDLSPAVKGRLFGARKIAYELLNPEAPSGKGWARGRPPAGTKDQRSHGKPASFATDTAKKIGEGARNVRSFTRIAQIGEPDLEKIKDTTLDTKAELLALARMGEAERTELVERAARGEKVTARIPESTPGFAKLCTAWKSASLKGRKAFVKEYHAELAEIIE